MSSAFVSGPLGGPVEARRRLGKWLQVTVNLPARKAGEGEAVVARLLALAPTPAVIKTAICRVTQGEACRTLEP